MVENTKVKWEARPASIPPYQRVEEKLRERIENGAWASGLKIPSRKNLAREYGVALATMERAIGNLLADGTLAADGSRGTFIARVRSEQAPRPAQTDHSLQTLEASRRRVNATLGVVATFSAEPQNDTGNFWMRTIANSLEQVFSTAGGSAHFYNRYRSGKPLIPIAEAVGSLLAEGIDALAIVLVDDPEEIEAVASAVDTDHLPLVFIASSELRRPLPHVFYDNQDAGYLAAQHLIRRGWKQLTFVAPFDTSWTRRRIVGAREAVAHAGLPTTALTFYPATPGKSPLLDYDTAWLNHAQTLQRYHEIGSDGARHILLQEGFSPTGLIAADDYLAFDLLHVAKEAGLALGTDLAVIGFDDNPEAQMVGLTSLRPPLEALGQEAARLLLLALQGEESSLQIRLRSHVVPRRSTRTESSRPVRNGASALSISSPTHERTIHS